MAQVTVTIGGKNYRVACNEGEEPHLESLAALVDAKVKDMRGAFGEIGDQRLVVMAALTIADDLSEARKTVAAHDAKCQDEERQAAAAAQALNDASARIEALAAALGSGAKA